MGLGVIKRRIKYRCRYTHTQRGQEQGRGRLLVVRVIYSSLLNHRCKCKLEPRHKHRRRRFYKLRSIPRVRWFLRNILLRIWLLRTLLLLPPVPVPVVVLREQE